MTRRVLWPRSRKAFVRKAEVAMPEELVMADGEVGVEEDFQNIPFANKR